LYEAAVETPDGTLGAEGQGEEMGISMRTKAQIKAEIKQIRQRAERSKSQADRIVARRLIQNLRVELQALEDGTTWLSEV
jgi:hypothetical protein